MVSEMKKYLIQIIAAGVGTLGFGLLFNLRTKHLVTAVLGGVFTWAVYLVLAGQIEGIFYPTLIASAFAALYSELMARKFKAPVPLYLLPSVVPLIPGGSLYYAMSYSVERNWQLSGEYGLATLQFALAIAVGMSVVWAAADMIKRGVRK